MIPQQLSELKNKLDQLYNSGMLDHKFLVIFGCNEPAERIIDYLEEKKLCVNAIIDNNEKKASFTYHGVMVYQPEKLLLNYREDAVILIASKYYQQMLNQVMNLGYLEEKQVFSLVDMQTGRMFSLEEYKFRAETEQIKKGTALLENIKEEHGYDTMIFLFPWQAIGDIYLAAGYLAAYIEKHQIRHFVITVIGNVGKQIVQLCGYENIVVLTKAQSYELSRSVIFLGLKSTNTMIIHHCLIHTNLIWKLGNYKGITFDDHFRHTIYGLNDEIRITEPPKLGKIDYLDKLFQINGLKPGKTVILAPYANTISNPSREFWMKLASRLKKEGYTVCTNSSGAMEPPIPGTKPVLFEFSVILDAIEFAGIFIGLRNGLCDYIASAKAKKIILYPDRIYNYGRVIDFYSLKGRNATKKIFEVTYSENCELKTIDKVIAYISREPVEGNSDRAKAGEVL